jgi:hypothetical protein
VKVILLSDEVGASTMSSQALRKHNTSIISHLNGYFNYLTTTSNNDSSDAYSDAYLDNIQTFILHIEVSMDIEKGVNSTVRYVTLRRY